MIDPNEFASLNANANQYLSSQTPQATAASKKKKRGNILTSLIPTATSILGGVAGSVVAPGVGTAVGGAGGAVLGKKIQDILTGEHSSAGSYGTEAALGALGGIGKAGRAVTASSRALKSGESLSKAASILKNGGASVASVEAAPVQSVMNGVDQLTSGTKRIPVKYTPTSTTAKVSTVQARGIPVKSINSESSGAAQILKTRNTLTDPKVQSIEDSIKALKDKGYSVKSKIGSITGRQSLHGKSVFEQSPTKSVISIAGRKVSVPIKTGDETSSILLPKDKPITGYKTSFANSEKSKASEILGGKPYSIQTEATATPSTPAQNILATSNSHGLKQKIADLGGNLRSDARGVQAGSMKEGSSLRVRPQEADRVNTFLDNIGAKGNPEKQMRTVEEFSNSAGKNINNVVKSGDRPTALKEINKIKETGLSAGKKALGFDENNHLITDLHSKLDQAHNLSDLKAIRSTLDTTLKSFYSKGERATGAPPTAVEQALKGYRDGINKMLSSSIPGFKEANTAYATAKDAQAILAKTAKKPNIRILGLDTGFGSGTPQSAKDMLGRALQKAEPTVSNGPPAQTVFNNAKNIAKTQIPARLLASSLLSPQDEQSTPATDQNSASSILNPALPISTASTSANIGLPTEATSSDSTYNRNNALKDIQSDMQRTGGANVDKIIKIFELANPAPAKSTSTSATGKPSAQQYGLAQSGLSSLKSLAATIDSDPSIIEKNATPGQGIPLVGSLISNSAGAAGYHASADNILSSLIHLQTGATATKEEMTMAHGQLPQPGDSPEVRKEKIATLLNNFQPFLGTN